MKAIERMQEMGLSKEDAKSVLLRLLVEWQNHNWREATTNFVIAVSAYGVSIINARAFVNSLTVAQLMEAKED